MHIKIKTIGKIPGGHQNQKSICLNLGIITYRVIPYTSAGCEGTTHRRFLFKLQDESLIT